VPNPQPYYSAVVPQNMSFNIDIDGDGTTDFVLTSMVNDTVYLTAQGNNQILVQNFFVGALLYGASIGSTTAGYSWVGGQSILDNVMGNISTPYLIEAGNFIGLTDGYIGFDLVRGGSNYYGWMEVSSPNDSGLAGDAGMSGTIIDWAYQTTPDTSILAGQATCTPIKISPVSHSSYVRLDWPSAAGNTFQVQYKEQLDATSWSNMDFAMTATGTNTTINLPMKSAACFYRVVQIKLGD
jgi:hypothetical protein